MGYKQEGEKVPIAKQEAKVEFTAEVSEYTVVKLLLNSYKGTKRTLEEGFKIKDAEIRPKIRSQEKRLLKRYFKNWKAPYNGNLKGWREDSPLYVLDGDKLICGLYLCDQNEFNEGEKWGQIHYVFTHPSYQGRSIYSVIFREAVNRAKSWGLQGIIFNTDRYLLSDVHIRWGATPWKKIPKTIKNEKPSLSKRGVNLITGLVRSILKVLRR